MEKLPSLILFAMGAVLLLAGWRSLRRAQKARADARRLATEGNEAQAQVTHKRGYPHPRRGKPAWFVDYSYTVSAPGGAEQTLSGQAEISQADFERLNVGDALAVRYAPGDPSHSILAIGLDQSAAPTFMADSAAGLVIGGVLILIGIIWGLR